MTETTPDTTGYMLLGFAVTIIILIALVGYFVLKVRNLRSELQTLEQLEAEDSAGNAESKK